VKKNAVLMAKSTLTLAKLDREGHTGADGRQGSQNWTPTVVLVLTQGACSGYSGHAQGAQPRLR